MQSEENIKSIFSSQMENEDTLTYKQRIKYLIKLEKWIITYKKRIIDAHFQDLHKPESEVEIAEIWYVLSEIKKAKKNLKKWMKPKRRGVSTLSLVTASSWVIYEPKGVVLIIAPWNFPFNLTVGPIISSLAAGNRIIVKPSEMTPNVSHLIQAMIVDIFPKHHVCVIQGDKKISKELLQYPFHHIFFTGSPTIGKVVMKEAARHLSGLTLELGGKSPTIIDKTAKIKMTVNKLVWGKCLNLGQSCIAPDYLLIHNSIKDDLIYELSKRIDYVYGPTYEEKSKSLDFARIVNKQHWDRLEKLLLSAIKNGASIAHGGNRNKTDLFIEPTILDSVSLDMDIMNEEIFGPLLPVLGYESLNQCKDIINKGSKPLALYIFSESKKNIQYISDNTSSGGMVINEVKSHFLNLNLPFGGVNTSGLGRSHGYEGFIDFSNQRSIQKNGSMSMIGLTFPPYTDWTKRVIKFVTKYL